MLTQLKIEMVSRKVVVIGFVLFLFEKISKPEFIKLLVDFHKLSP